MTWGDRLEAYLKGKAKDMTLKPCFGIWLNYDGDAQTWVIHLGFMHYHNWWRLSWD